MKITTLLLAAALAGLVACAGFLRSASREETVNPVIESSFKVSGELQPHIEALEDTDFSAHMVAQSSSIAAGFPGAPFSVEADDLDVASFSERELKLMTGRSDGHARTDLSQLLSLCCGFKKHNGTMPRNAGELLAWLWENDPAPGLRITALPKADQFAELGIFVNPLTGRFFESFEQKTWAPGGVDFVELTDREQIDQAHVTAFGWTPGDALQLVDSPDFLACYLIRVWGEEQDELLGARPVITMNPRVLTEAAGGDTSHSHYNPESKLDKHQHR